MPGATVNLRTPVNGSCTGGILQTKTTNGQGFYLFDPLNPGNYCVEFVPPNICAGNTPAVFTQQNAGGAIAVDSDADPQTGLTDPVTLAAGQTNLTVDAGVYCPAKLGDRIWLDNNQDGNQNCTGVDTANPGQVIPNGTAKLHRAHVH